MTLEEYAERYHCAPYELEKFAEGAEEVNDCPLINQVAKTYLEAKRAFEALLEELEIEVG